jgi:site-specific recombinase XerD
MPKSTDLTVPADASRMTVADLPAAAQERIRHFQAAAKAKNTSRAYGRLFRDWCNRQGYSDAPHVAPAIVARWLIERADAGASRSTLAVALAAIKFGHRIVGQRFDGADPDLVRAMAGARREAVREQGQAAPLRPVLLGDVLASQGESDLDRRDAALLATLYMLALRRSESRLCAFCERRVKMSSEHVWGKWLKPYVRRDMNKHHLHSRLLREEGPDVVGLTIRAGGSE